MAANLLTKEKKDAPKMRLVKNEELFGKPVFPNINLDNIRSLELKDLIDSDSWFFFHCLGINTDFLSHPAETWETKPGFIEAKNRVKNLHVVNDSAERGVKLTSDFLNTARKENIFQHLLQVVEKDRKDRPDQRKI